METKETEVRFLEVDKSALVKKLIALCAEDKGEGMLEGGIVYDKDLTWSQQKRFVRLRKSGNKTKMTYKEHSHNAKDGAKEVEFAVEDLEKAVLFLQKIGLEPYRRQQKYRHTLVLDGVTFDIDTWPRIPTYVELEGASMEALKSVAQKVGFDWSQVVYEDARFVIEKIYNIPLSTMRWLTFDRFE